MADTSPRPRSLTDSFGREIERLISQLPSADPTLRGEPEPRAVLRRPTPESRPRTAHQLLWGVWLRAFAALTLGVAVAYWPYARACGWTLYGYLAVIGVVLVAGSWASESAWRTRSAAAHVLGLLVIYWGVVLAAEQVLPRIGYAAVGAAWRCAG